MYVADARTDALSKDAFKKDHPNISVLQVLKSAHKARRQVASSNDMIEYLKLLGLRNVTSYVLFLFLHTTLVWLLTSIYL